MYRIVTAQAVGGYMGYVVERKGWFRWRSVSHYVFKSLDEAKAILEKVTTTKVGEVVYEMVLK